MIDLLSSSVSSIDTLLIRFTLTDPFCSVKKYHCVGCVSLSFIVNIVMQLKNCTEDSMNSFVLGSMYCKSIQKKKAIHQTIKNYKKIK